MPTFIDESGCTGHAPTSRPYFRLAAVWMAADDAARFRCEMCHVRGRLNLGANYEFKYYRTGGCPEQRAALYGAALACGFRFVVSCIDKSRGRWRRAPAADFHYATAVDLAATLAPVYRAAELAAGGRRLEEPLVVDDNHDKRFLRTVDTAFRGLRSGLTPGVSLTGRACFKNSEADDLLQLVDMTCGAVGDHMAGNSEWYRMIRPAGLGTDRDRGPGVSCY